MIPFMMPRAGLISGRPTLEIILSSNVNNINLFSLAGSPTLEADVNVIVNPGVIIGSTSVGSPAMNTGTFPSGTNLSLIVKGSIRGKEGAGGSQAAGQAGGNALNLGYPITIDNSLGEIFGGGGGGGGGAWMYSADGINVGPPYYVAGGTGGLGRGYGNPSGGLSGTSGATHYFEDNQYQEYYYGGYGGGGSDWGASGSPGGPSFMDYYTSGSYGGRNTYRSGYSGGAGGKAINLNGYAVTWLAGNTAARVKGAVS